MKFKLLLINKKIDHLFNKKKKISQKIEDLKLKRYNIQADIDIIKLENERRKRDEQL